MKARQGFRRLDSATLGQKFRQRVLRQYFVRFHMSLLLLATTSSGVLASKLLLMAGLTSVLVRYPLAVLLAYFVFVGLMRIWVAYVLLDVPSRKPTGSGLGSGLDPGNIDFPFWGGSSSGGGPSLGGGSAMSFGGGDSGGGGASDVWGVADTRVAPVSSGGGGGGHGFSFPSLDLDIDLDDGIWILALLALLVLVLFGAGGYLIYAAPQILPDIALNALLASCLTGAAKKAEAKGWLRSVLGVTWIPLLLILVTTIGLAVAVHKTCPSAPKLLDALSCPDGAVSQRDN
ncbi:hypothetical protein [Paludibaculum fermentans]|uniref:Uncharacterized protein n=1 Tax=Paludibaculum fermentans TaxID=1473598 RepID=A0A7S7NXK1_PALFE|nr:hypothetical protein [Paludibaculum fermentans]QOY91633.1 hypothetical protein IRI77_17315 [Paludibaculum fermentans]